MVTHICTRSGQLVRASRRCDAFKSKRGGAKECCRTCRHSESLPLDWEHYDLNRQQVYRDQVLKGIGKA
ncbi:MAG: hypothetical protein AB7E27_04645 [Candidatus Methanomethylophilaceae archaeon]|jgi:hypothetical protein